MELERSCCLTLAEVHFLYWKLDQSSAQCLAQSFYQSLVFELKYDIGQNHMFYLNPVQSSRSKLTTCLRKGRDLGVC